MMARKFNGTSDKGSRAINLSAVSLLTISTWIWWDTNSNNDKLAWEYGGTYQTGDGFICDPNNSVSSGTAFVGFGTATGGAKVWTDRFAQPSAAAWHHWLITHDRTTPVNKVWIDGVAQTLTTQTHTAGPYNNFSNNTLNIMCRNGASLFGAGRLADFTLWGGVLLGVEQAKALTAGSPPEFVWPQSVIWRPPLWGTDSPEPDYSGNRLSVTLTGTTWAAHPPVMPGLSRAPRSFQPMPV